MNDIHVLSAQSSESQAIEREVMNKCQALMHAVAKVDPAWLAYYEDSFPSTAEREVIVDLMNSAPNHFVLGLLYGKFLMRLEIAQITGREFE